MKDAGTAGQSLFHLVRALLVNRVSLAQLLGLIFQSFLDLQELLLLFIFGYVNLFLLLALLLQEADFVTFDHF